MNTKFFYAAFFLSLATVARGQITPGFDPGNLAVLRVGNGVSAVTNSGGPVFLDLYTTNGTLTNTVAIPTNGTTSLIIGSATSEGAISRSPNKNFITMVGYNTNLPYSSSLAGSTSAAVPRGIATIDYNGNFTFITNTKTLFSGNNIRSGTTDGSNNFWAVGATSGTIYMGLAAPLATVQSAVANSEVINIFNGALYFSSQKTTPIGISGFTGLPVTTNTTAALFIATGAASTPYGFAISPDSTIAYVADDRAILSGGGIQKYTNNGAWGLAYTLGFGAASTNGARGVAVKFSQPPVVYATTADTATNRLIAITDNGAGSPATVLATAAVNEIFRGVQFSPEGSPPSLVPLQDQTVDAGQDASFSVTATGSATLYYLWQSNLTAITPWTTASNLTLSTTSDSPGSVAVQVLVSNSWGTASSQATLTINPTNTLPSAPTISGEPQSLATNYGGTASFTVNAAGSSLAYAWQLNNAGLSDGPGISGSSTATLTLTNVSGASAGSYTVVVTNAGGSITSTPPAILTVADPFIISQPVGQTYLAGGTASLAVGAIGTQPGYQWRLNGSSISGATASAFQKTNLQVSDAGSYSVLVSNIYGSAISATTSVLVASSRTTLFSTNLVVLRLGDGAQTLINSGNTLFLDQFTSAGSYLSTMFIPDQGASALLISGVASSEGYMTRSADGRILAIGGYNTNRAALTSSLSSSTAAAVPRAIGAIDGAGTYTLAASTTSQYSGANLRSAVTDGANNFWGAGSAGGTYYFGTASPATTIQSTVANCRVINIINGSLAISTQSGTHGLYSLGGLPTSAAAASLLFATGSSSSPEDFAMDPSASLVYVADDSSAGGIQRWQQSSGAWTYGYTLTNSMVGIGARSLTVDFSGANPVVYAITAETAANRLIAITDTGPSSPAVTLATAANNEWFRAVKFGLVLNPFPSFTLDAPQVAEGQFNFSVAGVAGYSYVIQSSTDLIGWTSLQTNTAPFTFAIPSAGGAQFFRAVSQ